MVINAIKKVPLVDLVRIKHVMPCYRVVKQQYNYIHHVVALIIGFTALCVMAHYWIQHNDTKAH